MDFKKCLSLSGINLLENEPMSNHCGYGVGGNSRYFVCAKNLNEIKRTIDYCKDFRIKYKVIGYGTNLLFSDGGYDGVIISTKNVQGVLFSHGVYKVTCGTRLKDFIIKAVENNYCGLEGLIGIPATVGGAIVMNAGAFCHSISDYCIGVETLKNGKLKWYDKKDCKFSYRKSRFQNKKEIVLSASFSLPNCEDKQKILDYINEYSKKRTCVQPIGKSCGSVFKNPKGDFAGRLIDQAGLKGYEIGGAQISNVHGNFIITKKGATATDVANLIKYIKEQVKQKFNVYLTEEIEYIGKF